MNGFRPLSLAQHFEAPDNHRCCFGWLCGYSADAAFLDDAAERFTRQTRRSRESDGKIALAVMLDPGNIQITLTDAPSVAHLPIINPNDKPFLLLHAKIAILGFQSNEHGWLLRLIVSTGNWTRETLEDSIDLAWRIDLSSEDLKNPDSAVHQACADMKAAWNLLSWLKEFFDTKILDARPLGRKDSETVIAMQLFKSWIEEVEKNAPKNVETKPRFFDNREKSFFNQLPDMIKATGFEGKRNYLAMGSGFYETASNNNMTPSILSDICDSLRSEQFLTARPKMNIFVNPLACQSVAVSLDTLKQQGFTVRPAAQPPYFGQKVRSLHAKFIFSANYREDSDSFTSAWLYLGSGNLTGPGFRNKMSANGGNLEAGVVFVPNRLYWKQQRDINQSQVVMNVLPIQKETDVDNLQNKLSAGNDMQERDIQFIAAPIAWLLLGSESGSYWLMDSDGSEPTYEILDESGQPCVYDQEGKKFKWIGNCPRQVQLRWKEEGQTHHSTVPVLDEYGRFAATALSQIDIDEAWWQLANFPMPPNDEDIPPVGEPKEQTKPIDKQPTTKYESSYPIRRMMQLIENIAEKQTRISQVDWASWCNRLEQCLTQVSGSLIIDSFVKMEINPISPLWYPPFRPEFAESDETKEGQRYEDVLKKIEAKWNVGSLTHIRGVNDDRRME